MDTWRWSWHVAAGAAAGLVLGVLIAQAASPGGWISTAIVGLGIGLGLVGGQAWAKRAG